MNSQTAAHQEMERKFLLKNLPRGWKDHPHVKITQGYFVKNDTLEIRLRHIDDQHSLTIKGGLGAKRQEEEIPISPDCFARLWPLTRNWRISKTRYKIPFLNKTIEMDVYGGPHKGLVSAEIEFDNMRELRNFQFPDCFGEEITGNPEYANAELARKSKNP